MADVKAGVCTGVAISARHASMRVSYPKFGFYVHRFADSTQCDVGGEAAGSLGVLLSIHSQLLRTQALLCIYASKSNLHHDVMEISSPRELIAAIPHLLGFVPEDSLVVVALVDNDVHSMVRVDWPVAPSVMQGSLTRYAQSITNIDVVLCLYADADVDTYESVQEVFSESEILDILQVKHGFWKSTMCEDSQCCPPQGRPIDDFASIAATEFVYAGSSPFASREDLVSALAAESLSGTDRYESERAFAVIHDITDPKCEVDWILSRASRNDTALFSDIARTSIALQEIRVRDGVLRRAFESVEVRISMRGWLMQILGKIPEHQVAACATVLAGVVWLDGNGSLARIALDRALDADPDYSLAQLLDTALVNAVPSRVWTESLEAVSYDECVRGAA